MWIAILVTALLSIISPSSACDDTACPDIASDHNTKCNKYHYADDGDGSMCNNHICDRTVTIGYLDYPPYIYTDTDGNTRGMWKGYLENYLRVVCSPTTAIVWQAKSSQTVQNTEDLVKNCGGCTYSIPIVAPSDACEAADTEFAPFFPIRGVAFLTLKYEEWKQVTTTFGDSLVGVWPFFLLAIVGATIAGIIIWILDSRANEKEFPPNFYRGAYEGFWWGFVSMTTVGYGDKAPVSFVARMFSVFWIIIGITIVSILTSILSNALTQASTIPEVLMADKKVGYLDVTAHERQVILREKGTPIAAKSIEDLETQIATGLIDGIALDTDQLEYFYKKRLSKINGVVWKMQRIYSFNQRFGVSFYFVHDGSAVGADPTHDIKADDWRGCLAKFDFKNSRFDDVIYGINRKDESGNVYMEPSILHPAPAETSIFDTSSDEFWEMLEIIAIALLGMLVLGFAFDLINYYYKVSLGSGMNAGYVGDKPATSDQRESSKGKNLSKEEKVIGEMVERTLNSAENKLKATEKAIKFDIMEMSRVVRQEMNDLRRRAEKS